MNSGIMPQNTRTIWLSWRFAFILGIALILYLPALRGGFIWDDDAYVTANTALRSLRGLWEIWFQPGRLEQYYPLTYSSFWVEYHLWGLHPFGYHLVNVLLHTANSLLVWRLLEHFKIRGARFAALIFLIHPVHVESVAWITERKNVLSGFFYLSALGAYLQLKEKEAMFCPRYFLSFFLFTASLFCKTITATFPITVLLLLWWQNGRVSLKEFLRLLPFLAASVFPVTITTIIETHQVLGVNAYEWNFSFIERCLIAGRAAWFYLGKLIWPHPLIFTYPRWTINTAQLWQWGFPVSYLLLLASLWQFRSRWGRGPLTAFAIFTVTLLPALGFKNYFPMRFSFVADHFQYLASIALLALFTAGAVALFEKHARVRIGAGILVVFVFSLLTFKQCEIYRNLETLWRDTLKKNPGSWMAHNNLSAVLLLEADRDDEALYHLKEAIRLKSDNAEAYGNFGYLMKKQGDMEKALAFFQQAIRFQPNSWRTENSIGFLLLHFNRTDEAISHLVKALTLDRGTIAPSIRFNLGNVMLKRGETQKAVYWYRQALAITPDHAGAWVNLGAALARLGQTQEAINSLGTGLKLNPGHAVTHNNLANLLSLTKERAAEAELHYREAIRLKPEIIPFRINYASFLTHSGRIDEAIEQYNEILRLDPKNPEAQRSLLRISGLDFQQQPQDS